MGRTGPIVVMGVAGSGKTTIGRLLAERLSTPYAEADDHHPPDNVEKMARGIPLTDEDRAPWLAAIARRIAAARATGGLVVSCSALKRSYRDILRNADPQILFVHLLIDQARAADRVAVREGHFMPASLVASQFAALEPLQADERAVCVSATQTPERIVAAVLGQLPVVNGPGRTMEQPVALASRRSAGS